MRTLRRIWKSLRQCRRLRELTRIGVRVMLQVALEEEITANLGLDYYLK